MLLETLIVLIVSFQACLSKQMFLTATEMKDLLHLEHRLSNAFLSYYAAETERLDELEKFLNNLETQMELRGNEKKRNMMDSKQFWVSNPTTTYRVIDRFLKMWTDVSWMQSNESNQNYIEEIQLLTMSLHGFDESKNIRGAIHTLLKLQQTYNLSIDSIVSGVRQPAHKLNFEEIYQIAMYANHFWEWDQAKQWAQYLINHLPDKTKNIQIGDADSATAYEIMAWAAYKQKKYSEAVHYTKKALKLNDVESIRVNLDWFMQYAESDGQDDIQTDIRKVPLKDHNVTWHNTICRREENLNPAIASTLTCSFSKPHPQFFLKPLKEEVMYHNPRIVVFHDILSSDEVEYIKDAARMKLNTAHVYSMKDGELTTADYRISKSAWLLPTDPVVWKIMQRVGALANLDMLYSEPLQVANYGIGGNYEAHFDYASPPHNSSIFGQYDFGNRIATMLFYLETVEKGGDTAFVNIGPGVSTPSIRGSGVFWYNLNRNGSGNTDTKHAACPVLLGEKWVSNLWIHEHGQEFRRKCTLNPNE